MKEQNKTFESARRNFLKKMGLGTGALAVGGGLSSCEEKHSEEKAGTAHKEPVNPKARRIVFIMTDTTRWDMIGAYGREGMRTPNIDKFASEGTRFNLAYSVSPVCGPARSAIFTGTYPSTNGVWGNNLPLGDNIRTVGKRFTDYGYRSAFIGKWHLDGYDYFGNGKCPDGYEPEYWYDMRTYLEELSDDDRKKSRDVGTIHKGDGIDSSFTFGHRVTDRAIDFLDNSKDDDFLLTVSYDEPHHPFLMPKEFADLYKGYKFQQGPKRNDNLKDKPAYQSWWAKGEHLETKEEHFEHPFFLACNTYIDQQIGRLVDKINETCPDALVIFTSDHGDMMGAHNLKGKGPAIYDDISRIPFIVRWPGHVKAGAESDVPISHISVTPTLLDVAGIPVPDHMQGKSIVPTLEEDKPVTDAVFMEFGRFEVNHDGFGAFQPYRAVFDGRYKLAIHLLSDKDEMYDMQNDPDEMKNLIASEAHTEIRNRLHDRILKEQGETRDPFRGTYWAVRPWRNDIEHSWEYTRITRSRKDCGYEPMPVDYNTGLEITKDDYTRVKGLDKKK
ncbi:putative sulfatase YidJ (plasmid) [Fulvitalea axinellae]|uniref:Sulfatase YidJ n=1 Tax=Fulvitalea axinellae TaxID=1182444 RepID=A0AAU9DGQ6_9BACT|nr:putative sulfatase YidJ [Fulvitalea axinellae]